MIESVVIIAAIQLGLFAMLTLFIYIIMHFSDSVEDINRADNWKPKVPVKVLQKVKKEDK